MSFANGKIAKIWEIKQKENYTEVKISTSRKKENGYEQDFGAFVRFIGKAKEKIKDYSGNENIKLVSVETTNRYDAENKKMYYNFACFDFEPYNTDQPKQQANTATGSAAAKPATPPMNDDDDMDLPF